MMLEISLPLSLTNLFLTYAIWFGEIRDGKTVFNLSANVLDSESTLSKEIGLQFSMKHLSLSFFIISLMTASLWELLNSFHSSAVLIEFKNGSARLAQKVS